jgi:thiosulfate dehydrogenase [quinone] large subunit
MTTNVTGAPAPTFTPTARTAPPIDETTAELRLTRPAARSAALLRIGLGLIYLWAFVAQAFGIVYTNRPAPPPGAPPAAAYAMQPDGAWHVTFDTSKGFVTSGFSYSPTAGYLKANARGPLAFVPNGMPDIANDLLWMFALGGLGIALVLGIFSKIAGWGGLVLNVLMWFSSFPNEFNPILDGEHMIYALVLITLLYVRAGDHWGLGRWWRARTPSLLH